MDPQSETKMMVPHTSGQLPSDWQKSPEPKGPGTQRHVYHFSVPPHLPAATARGQTSLFSSFSVM